MKKYVGLLLLSLLITKVAMAQDIIVKTDGTIMSVYNLEESDASYYYSLEPSEVTAVQKISKSEVFSVKRQNGSTAQQSGVVANGSLSAVTTNTTASKHEPVTAQISSTIVNDKKKGKCFSARTPDNHELNYIVISESEHTLSVAKGEYHETDYVIPEYVKVDNFLFVVKEIDEKAFFKKQSVKNIQFPSTLKKIGKKAFVWSGLERIILPEGLEVICDQAFMETGRIIRKFSSSATPVSEIYLPSSLRTIGSEAFLGCGSDFSYRGFCQAYFSNMPNFITEGNCKGFGIDEEAVRAFQNIKR